MSDIWRRLEQCRREFIQTSEAERNIYLSYCALGWEHVSRPCRERTKRPPYEMLKQLSETVRNSLTVPESNFEQQCLDLAFSTNPLFGYSPDHDGLFAEQWRVLHLYEKLYFSRPRPQNLAWCVELCVAIVMWYDLLFSKDRYLSGDYKKLIRASSSECDEKQRREYATLQMLQSEEWDAGKMIETLETLFPDRKTSGEEAHSFQAGLRAHLFCHCLAFAIAELLCPYDPERPSQHNHDLVLGCLIEWNGAVRLFAPRFHNLIVTKRGTECLTEGADTKIIPSPNLLYRAATTFQQSTQDLLRGVEDQDEEMIVSALSELVWAARIFETPAEICPIADRDGPSRG